jgi:hypothetical protein
MTKGDPTRHKPPPLYLIFNCPHDFPQQFACRIWRDGQRPELFAVADSLEQVRKTMPFGMRYLGTFTFEQIRRAMFRYILRHQDDSVSVEAWF